MALPRTIRFADTFVRINLTGASDGFTSPCGFTSKAVTFDAALAETVFGDCTDRALIPPVTRDKVSRSMAVVGEGVLTADSVPTWTTAYERQAPVICRVEFTWASSVVIYEGRFHIASLTAAASLTGGRATLNVDMRSTGRFGSPVYLVDDQGRRFVDDQGRYILASHGWD